MIKQENFLFIFVFLSYWTNFVGTQKRVRISHGKRAIGVRAIEVQLYIICIKSVRSKLKHMKQCYLYQLYNRHSGSVVERPLCDREVADSIPGQVIPKTLKMVLAALSLGAQH